MHFAIGEITTKNMETLLRYIEKIDHSRVSLVTAYHPVLKHIDWQHPKKELPILYRNEKMTDLFNDPQMAAYIYQTSEEHQGTVLSESEIRQLITQRWLKTCSEVRCRLCKNSTDTNCILVPLRVPTTKYRIARLVAQTIVFTSHHL